LSGLRDLGRCRIVWLDLKYHKNPKLKFILKEVKKGVNEMCKSIDTVMESLKVLDEINKKMK